MALQPLHVSISQARRLILQKQSLWPPRLLKGKAGVLQHLQNVRLLQFDPVDLVGTSPQIALNARVKDFKPAMLNELLYQDRVIYDQWDRCASIVLDEDLEALQKNRSDTNWRPRHDVEVTSESLAQVRERLAAGPLPMTAFPEPELREALLHLLPEGVVAIHHREGPLRFFCLNDAARQARLANTSHFVRDEDFFAWMVQRRVGSVGLISARPAMSLTLLSVRGLSPQLRRDTIARLLDEDLLRPLRVENLSGPGFYCLESDLSLLEAEEIKPRASFIAPLDNLIWDRDLIEQLFGFFYRWEIYTKQEKRIYGPYTLPVLYGDRFVARVQLKAREGRLEVDGWWWELQVKATVAMRQAIDVALKAHARMLGLEAGEVGPHL